MVTKEASLLTELSILREYREEAPEKLARDLDEEIHEVEAKLSELKEEEK